MDDRNFTYGRCTATSKRSGERCKNPATDNRGVCHIHGGKTPLQNGIYSDVVREEDRKVLDALEDIETRQKLEETLNLQIMKLRRAVELMDNADEERDFWQAFQNLTAAARRGEELEADQIRELSKMLSSAEQSQMQLMDLIRKTAKALADMEDDAPDKVEHSVDSDQVAELRGLMEAAYGDDGGE